MCLLCKDSNWFLEIAHNYLTGAWTRKFLEANPKIIENHAPNKIPNQKKFFDDMDAMIKKHKSGEKAFAVIEAEMKPIIRQWRIDNNHWIPENYTYHDKEGSPGFMVGNKFVEPYKVEH